MIEVGRHFRRQGPLALFDTAWRHRQLILRLSGREIEGRFRGSLLGKAWAVIVPLFMLGMYTFVFSVVFRINWPGVSDSPLQVALLYFAGLVLFDFWFECINRSPTLLLENVPYIKKVVFPLEILPWIALGGAVFRVALSGAILLAFYLVIDGLPPLSALAVPVVLLPLALVALGFMWFLSAAGIYLRDLRQAIVVVAPTAMFLSPIFYPLAAVPEPFQTVLYLNPLTLIIETVRAALFLGIWPNWTALACYTAVAGLFTWAGYAWFIRLRGGFADVV